jgi:hypothetical protein
MEYIPSSEEGRDMSFDPDTVGLHAERVSGRFEESRSSGCPHRGLDISSSGVPKPFIAGIYGTVVEPINTGYGTIAVQPFGDATSVVQYLHCSSSRVNIGDVVAPWTVLGTTGDKAPPGTDIHGIHLHIQVISPGKPKHSCWNRNYVDPGAWTPHFAFAGKWSGRLSNAAGTSDVDVFINGDTLSSTGNAVNLLSYYASGDVVRFNYSLAVIDRNQNRLVLNFSKAGCEIVSSKDSKLRCRETTPPGTTLIAVALSADRLRVEVLGNVRILRRSPVSLMKAEAPEIASSLLDLPAPTAEQPPEAQGAVDASK